MPLYRYECLNARGSTVKGTMEGSSPQEIKDKLRSDKLMPIAVYEASGEVSTFSLRALFERSIDLKTKILFTNQLSVLLKSGVPLLAAVNVLSAQFEGKMRRILINVKDDLKGGKSFADALAQYPRVFSKVYVQLVKAGEASGKLETILARLVDYLERTDEVRRRVRKALSYPITMLGFAAVVSVILVVFIVPSVVENFTQTGTDLPMPTQILLGISHVLTEYGIFVLMGLGIAGLGFMYWKSTMRGKLMWDKFILKIPVVSYIVRTRVVVQFSKTLGMLLDSGVHLADALDIVTTIMDNVVLTQTLKSAREKIIKEGRVARYLKETNIFPPIASYMIETGEQSGEFATMLLTVGRDYDQELTDLIDGLIAKVNPLMMLVVGGIVLFIVLSMVLPMARMGEALGLGGEDFI